MVNEIEGVIGSGGNDTITGLSGGDSYLAGGGGNDKLIVKPGAGTTVVWGGAGADTVIFEDFGYGGPGILVVDASDLTEDNFHELRLSDLNVGSGFDWSRIDVVVINPDASDVYRRRAPGEGPEDERRLFREWDYDPEDDYGDPREFLNDYGDVQEVFDHLEEFDLTSADGAYDAVPRDVQKTYDATFLGGSISSVFTTHAFDTEVYTGYSVVDRADRYGVYEDAELLAELGMPSSAIFGRSLSDLYSDVQLDIWVDVWSHQTGERISAADLEAFVYDEAPSGTFVAGGVVEFDANGVGRLVVSTQNVVTASLPVSITGTDADEDFLGSDARDSIFADAGNDRLVGGARDDVLRGGEGDDTLIGGRDADTLEGGVGADLFAFATGDGSDVISDFEIATDTITIDDVAFAPSRIDAMVSAFSATATSAAAQDGDDIVVSYGDGDQIRLTDRSLVDWIPPAADTLDLTSIDLASHAGSQQDRGEAAVSDSGRSIGLEDNAWKALMTDVVIEEDTVLRFRFAADASGEIRGIGFDTDDGLSPEHLFRIQGPQDWGIGDYADQYAGDVQTYEIAVGQHFTGAFDRIVLTGDDDGGATDGINTVFSDIQIGTAAELGALSDEADAAFEDWLELPAGRGPVAVTLDEVVSHGGTRQDHGTVSISEDGSEVTLEGNAWKAISQGVSITADTRMRVTFEGSPGAEIQGIGFDVDGRLSEDRFFQIAGTQDWGIQDYVGLYTGGRQSYEFAVGQHFTGIFDRIVLAGDLDAGDASGLVSTYADIEIL